MHHTSARISHSSVYASKESSFLILSKIYWNNLHHTHAHTKSNVTNVTTPTSLTTSYGGASRTQFDESHSQLAASAAPDKSSERRYRRATRINTNTVPPTMEARIMPQLT